MSMASAEEVAREISSSVSQLVIRNDASKDPYDLVFQAAPAL